MKRYRISAVVEKGADGYFAFCPDLQGCYTHGDSYEEVLENIGDAIRLYIADMNEDGRCTNRSDDGAITDSVRNLTIGRRFSKEEQNIVKDIIGGLSG